MDDSYDVAETDESAAGEGGLLGTLRASVLEAASDEHLELKIPGMSLVVRYKFVDVDQLSSDAKKYKSMPAATAAVQASLAQLAKMCECILGVEEDGEEIPLHEHPSVRALGITTPVRFDDQLRTILGLEPATNAKQTVYDAFRKNEYAVIEHARRLTQWLKDTTGEAEDSLLGG